MVDSPGALLSAAVSGGLLDEAALGALLLSVFRPSLCGILLTNDGREAVAATMSVTVSDIMKRGGPDAMRAMRGAAERVLSRELVNLNGFDYARYAKISHPELVSIFGGNRLLCCEFGDLVPAGSASSLLRFAIGMPATAPPVEVQVRGRAAALCLELSEARFMHHQVGESALKLAFQMNPGLATQDGGLLDLLLEPANMHAYGRFGGRRGRGFHYCGSSLTRLPPQVQAHRE